MEREPNQAGSSLSPTEIERASLDLEAAPRKGNGLRLVALTAGCALVIGVSVLALGDLDNRHTFIDAGTRINALHEVGFERFWNCTLIGLHRGQLQNPEQVELQIALRIAHYGRNYATLIEKCSSGLDAYEHELSTQQVPRPLRAPLDAMRSAVRATRHAARELAAGIDADPKTSAMGRGTHELGMAWQQYTVSHEAFRKILRDQLQ